MNIQPLSNRVVLKPLDEEKMTQSGIVLPDRDEKPTTGEVVAVGPGKKGDDGTVIPMEVQVGQKVLFKKYGFDEVEVEGEKYLIGDEGDIVAVLDK